MRAPPPLSGRWSVDDDGVGWVDVRGRLNLTTSAALRLALSMAAERADLMVLDLRRLSAVDAVGVAVVVAAAERARRRRRRLIVLRGPDHVDEQFARCAIADRVHRWDIDPDQPAAPVLLALAAQRYRERRRPPPATRLRPPSNVVSLADWRHDRPSP